MTTTATSRRGEARRWLTCFLADPPTTDDCVTWPFSTNSHGYPQIKDQGAMTTVSRIILTDLVGPPPAGTESEAAHTPLICHHRACINPRHLRWATRAENNADKLIDGTQPRGQRHGRAKLTNEAALAIYNAIGRHHDIATTHNVTRQTVDGIKNGRKWNWLTGHRRPA